MQCEFCHEQMEDGTGILYVRKTGDQFYLCSSKCRNNMLKLKRNPRKMKWVETPAVITKSKKQKEKAEEKAEKPASSAKKQ